jgi:hypothetical protein
MRPNQPSDRQLCESPIAVLTLVVVGDVVHRHHRVTETVRGICVPCEEVFAGAHSEAVCGAELVAL